MVDLNSLITELAKPEYDGLDDAAILAALNDDTIDYWVEPETGDVHNFLVESGLYAKLLNAYHNHPVIDIRLAAEEAIDTVMGQIKTIDLKNNPMIQQLLPGMVAGGVFTQPEADALVDFAKRTTSRAAQLFEQDVQQSDLNQMRLLPKLNAVAALQQRHARAANIVSGWLADLEAQVLAGDEPDVPDWAMVTSSYGEVE